MEERYLWCDEGLRIPEDWTKLDLSGWAGMVMVIGAPDTGKSTLARYLYRRIRASERTVAYLDGDPGQSSLGPPATLSIVFDDHPASMNKAGEKENPDHLYRSFIGSTTPRRHMLPLLVGAEKLYKIAHRYNIEVILYDTCGLIDPLQGGVNLKLAKIDLLLPRIIIAIQRETELEALLIPLRRSHGNRLIELRPSALVNSRTPEVRRVHRAEQFTRYFTNAQLLSLEWDRFAILPLPQFILHRLVAFVDQDGFLLELGIVVDINRQSHRLTITTPLKSLAVVNSIRLGDILVDPHNFHDSRLESA